MAKVKPEDAKEEAIMLIGGEIVTQKTCGKLFKTPYYYSTFPLRKAKGHPKKSFNYSSADEKKKWREIQITLSSRISIKKRTFWKKLCLAFRYQ